MNFKYVLRIAVRPHSIKVLLGMAIHLRSIKVCIEDGGSSALNQSIIRDGGASALNQSIYRGWRCVRAQSKYKFMLKVIIFYPISGKSSIENSISLFEGRPGI